MRSSRCAIPFTAGASVALSVTGNPHYQEAFQPLMGGVKFADFNDLASVKSQVTDKTCAIILETVQGEGGIYPADPDISARQSSDLR